MARTIYASPTIADDERWEQCSACLGWTVVHWRDGREQQGDHWEDEECRADTRWEVALLVGELRRASRN